MGEITTIFGSLSRLLAIVGGGISTVAVCYAGILWITSSGDPQSMGKARMALMGAVGGLIIVGVAFIIPRIIGETVIESAGGYVGGAEAVQNCDDLLRNQFVFQRNASTRSSLQAVIANIQNQRVEQCSVDVWHPLVAKAADVGRDSPYGCSTAESVGNQDVPSGLHRGPPASYPERVRKESGRDGENNIIVHWVHASAPTDNAKCWLYVSRLRTWTVE